MSFRLRKTAAALACLVIIFAACSGCVTIIAPEPERTPSPTVQASPTTPPPTTASPSPAAVSPDGPGVSAMSDEELADYLLATVPEAYERVYNMRGALEPIVTGDTTTLDEGVCRDVWLVFDATDPEPIIKYTVAPSGTVYEYDKSTGEWFPADTRPYGSQTPPVFTMEEARDYLSQYYIETELFYPGELDIWEGDDLLYCFVFEDVDMYRYVYINSRTFEVEIVDEIENYTREG